MARGQILETKNGYKFFDTVSIENLLCVAFSVICWSWLPPVCKNQLCTSCSRNLLGDALLVVEISHGGSEIGRHHRNWQMIEEMFSSWRACC